MREALRDMPTASTPLAAQTPGAHRADELYVGYLPVPVGVRRFVRFAAPLLMALVALIALLLARTHSDPGDGVWDDATARSFAGVLHTSPYPLLVPDAHTAEREGDDPLAPRAYLVVGFGKHGAAERLEGLGGTRVRLRGWRLQRQGRRMIELDPTPDAVASAGAAAMSTTGVRESPVAPPRRVTLRGEIVDSKCYLGAMKPGDGRTHKACATLCIRGGIPPSFVSRNADGTSSIYLLVNEHDEPLSPSMHPFIADAVELTGELTEFHGLPVIRVAPNGIRRL